MTVLLYALLALFGFAALFGLYDYYEQRRGQSENAPSEPKTQQPQRAACGLTDVCTMNCALAAPQEPAGLCAMRMGDADAGREYLMQALATAPAHRKARELMEWIG